MARVSSRASSECFFLILAGLILPACLGSVSRIRGEDLKPFSEGTLTLPRSEDKQTEAYYRFLLGNLYAQEDNDSQAIEEIQKTLALVPDSPFLEFSLGRLFFKTQPTRGPAPHPEGHELDPKFQEAYSLLAEIYISQQKWEEA